MKEVKRGSLIFSQDGVLSPELCREIIDRFEADPRKSQSVVGYPPRVDKEVRDTTELGISMLPEWSDIDKIIQTKIADALSELSKSFPGMIREMNDSGYYVLRYKPGSGYTYHCDYNTTSRRQIAFIIYLNTIKRGGRTHFKRSGIKIAPVEGRIAVFPPHWTHEHAGLPPIGGHKYVIVTWACF